MAEIHCGENIFFSPIDATAAISITTMIRGYVVGQLNFLKTYNRERERVEYFYPSSFVWRIQNQTHS